MKKIMSVTINIFAILILLTSCTERLWHKNPAYIENFNNFYMTDDSNKIVIIGEKYHYVFSIDQRLKDIIKWPNNNILRLDLLEFRITDDNRISGTYELRAPNNKITTEERKWLENNHFIKPKSVATYGNLDVLYYKGKLEGTRYLSNKVIPGQLNSFAREYEVRIEENFSLIQKSSRIMATPITVLADGSLVIVGAAVFMPLIGICVAENKIKGNKMFVCTP